MSSLNARLKAVEDEISKIVGVSEDKVDEMIVSALKPVQDRAQEIAVFTGVDEDKPLPTEK